MNTYLSSLNLALAELLEKDPSVYIMGEDILDPYGGAFKVTKGLSTRFPGKLLTTPISEGAIIGIAAGMSMRGLHPIVEIMFGDFLTLCCDQIVNHISKFRWMYNNQVQVPLVIRTPMGGYRGYGPSHSQSLEKMFLGIPGLKIVAPSHFHNPGDLLKTATLVDEAPVLFIENKLLYPRELVTAKEGYVDDFVLRLLDKMYPTVMLSTNNFESPDVTVLTYGGMLPMVVEAATELLINHEIFLEIIVPACIKPFEIQDVIISAEKSRRVIIVEEGTLSNGWGAEVSSQIYSHLLNRLKCPIQRIAALNFPIANTKSLESKILPSREDIVRAVLECMNDHRN